MTNATAAEPPTALPLSQRQIFAFFVPLLASWLLMTVEVPAISAAVARLPQPERMIAALGILMALSVTIESPVIMLLGTSTALARHAQAYRVLRRFTFDLCVGLTVITGLIAFTPLYDLLLLNVMGIPESIASLAQPGLQIMLLWSAAIGWRRFKQGLLIHFGYTRRVGWGTAVRLVASAGTALILALWGGLPGVQVGAIALMVGVVVEAAFIELLSRDVIAKHLATEPDTPAETLSYGAVVRYHTPLALTSLMILLAQPIIGAALARTPNPERALAAWPLTFGVLLISRSFGLALPELVIALLQKPRNFSPVRRFAQGLALFSGVLLLLMVFTPLGMLYYTAFIGVAADLAADALPGVLFGLPLPILMVWASWERAVLMTHKRTTPLSVAMVLHLGVLLGVLGVGVVLGLPGVPLAAAALVSATFCESLYLHMQATDLHRQLAANPLS